MKGKTPDTTAADALVADQSDARYPPVLLCLLRALDDIKALDVCVYSAQGVVDYTDWLVLASGTSTRHLQAVADRLIVDIKELRREQKLATGEADIPAARLEGQGGEWLVLDASEVVVHLQMPAKRDLYDLDGLWGAHEEQDEERENKP